MEGQSRTEKSREAMGGQILCGLVGHCKDFGVYSD